VVAALKVWGGRGANQLWSWSRSTGHAGIERLGSETLKRPAVKRVLVSGVIAMLTFVLGSIAWIDLNSSLTPRDGQIVTGVREFTLRPVFWLAVAVFVVTWSLSMVLVQSHRHTPERVRPFPEQRRKTRSNA
jgi:hypothetical protein